MFSEQWIQWNPLPDLSKAYILEKFVDDVANFEIYLVDRFDLTKRVCVIFESGGLVYRQTKIKYKKKTLGALHAQHGQAFLDWTFFKVNNSRYVQWLAKQACEIYPADDFAHFVFLTGDSILEVIDGKCYTPLIEIANRSNDH